MKKTLVTLTLLTGLAVSSYGQGYIYFDASLSSGLVSISSIVDTATDVNAVLINQTLGTTVATLLLSATGVTLGPVVDAAGDITAYGDGHLFDNSGQSYITGLGSTQYSFVVEAWLGGDTYAGATTRGTSASFLQTTAPPASPVGSLDMFPGMNLVVVPEPTTLALAGLGAAGLLAFRRRS
jgi:hypothetical protein